MALRALRRLRASRNPEIAGANIGLFTCSFGGLASVVGRDEICCMLVSTYIDTLANGEYLDRGAILEGLPGSVLAGAFRWLMSWSLEEGYSKALADVAGNWWRTTLDDILRADFAMDETNQDRSRLTTTVQPGFVQRGDTILESGEGDLRILTDQRNGQRLQFDPLAAKTWECLETPATVPRIVAAMQRAFPGVDAQLIAASVLNLLASFVDYGLVDPVH